MSPDPQSPSGPTARTDAFRGVVLLLAVVVGLSALFFDWGRGGAAEAGAPAAPSSASASSAPTTSAPSTSAPATTSATATRTRQQLRVPDVTGLRLDLAEQQVLAFKRANGLGGGLTTSHDLSPRDRSQWDDENWTVVTTRPAAGEPLLDGSDLHLFVLRNAEWAWFQANPTMPTVPADVATSELTDDDRLFGGVSELLEYRYAPGHEPEYSSAPYSRTRQPIHGLSDDPSVEPAAEQQERDALALAHEYGTLTVGSLPPEGTTLRVGRLLTLTVRKEPYEPPPPVTGGGDVDYSDGDDDVNVPGWLCPTRFC